MKIKDRINLLKEDIRNDYIACYLEMSDIISGLDDGLQFDILTKMVEISYRTIIQHHRHTTFPKEVLRESLKQGNFEPKQFLKLWQKGELPSNYNWLPEADLIERK